MMIEIQPILQGFSTRTTEGNLAYCAVTLLRGQKLTLVDVGYQARLALLMRRLQAAGVEAEQIERVVLTHAHWDHSLNLLAFPNAEVVIHRDEYDYCANPHPRDWATPCYLPNILARAPTVTAVNDGDELEPGMRVMAVPGHSPGSMAILVETPEGTVGIVGDALPNRAAAASPFPSAGLVFFNEAAARRSGRRILDTCRFIYPGHDRGFRVESGSFHYFQTTSLTIVDPPHDEDGAVLATVDPAEIPFEVVIETPAHV